MKLRSGYISTGGYDVYIKLGDSLFYGGDDLLMNADPSKYKVQNKETGEEENSYKVLWKLAAEQLRQQYEPVDDDPMSPEEHDELEEWVIANLLKKVSKNEN